MGFSDSFVLQGHGVSRVSPSGRAVWLCFCAVAAAAAAAAANFLQVFCSFFRVSDVTLKSFWVGFSDSFVLQGASQLHKIPMDASVFYFVPRNCIANYLINYISFKPTSSTTQGGGGSFKNRKPIGEVRCCESGMAERIH